MDEPARLGMEIGAGTAACGAAAWLAWAVRGRSAQIFGPSVWRGRPEQRAVSLTFDDGPSESTPRILDILAHYRAPATFFQCGANVERLPEVARAVSAAGHEIGNHGHAHPLYCFRSPRFIETDLRLAQEAIATHAGIRPRWFRPPFGARWFGVGQAQRRLELMGVMWTVIGYDWKLGAGEVVERILAHLAGGAILCLHDGRELRARPDIGVTVEAVRHLIPMVLERGYKFETLSRLLCPTS
jgi:peptidoglycan/xylan/chitin deacetylase (PgdA/CDA1 family)